MSDSIVAHYNVICAHNTMYSSFFNVFVVTVLLHVTIFNIVHVKYFVDILS